MLQSFSCCVSVVCMYFMFLHANACTSAAYMYMPPRCSPLFTDPTLTLNNVTVIMKDVQGWEVVADWIGINYFKRVELKRFCQNPTTDQHKQAYWDYWFHHHSAPSWRILADGLYCCGEHGALEVLLMNYLKGKNIGAYHDLLGNCPEPFRCNYMYSSSNTLGLCTCVHVRVYYLLYWCLL